MSGMPTLARVILRAMRVGALAAAGFVILVIGIEMAKRWAAGGFGAINRADATMFAVLAVLLLGALCLAWWITRELRKPGP
jgi:hypothetical protein